MCVSMLSLCYEAKDILKQGVVFMVVAMVVGLTHSARPSGSGWSSALRKDSSLHSRTECLQRPMLWKTDWNPEAPDQAPDLLLGAVWSGTRCSCPRGGWRSSCSSDAHSFPPKPARTATPPTRSSEGLKEIIQTRSLFKLQTRPRQQLNKAIRM